MKKKKTAKKANTSKQSTSSKKKASIKKLSEENKKEIASRADDVDENNENTWGAIAIFSFGVIFAAVLLILAFVFPNPTPFQYEVCRIILAVAVAGVATQLTGLIDIEIPNLLKAGGAGAVFAVVYFYSPAELVLDKVTKNENVNRINSLLDDDYLESASREINNWLIRDPDDATVHNLHGSLLVKKNNYTHSLGAFEKAVLLSSEDRKIDYKYNYAFALSANRNFEEAAKIYQEILSSYPDDRSSKFNFSIALVHDRKFSEGRDVLNELIFVDNNGAEDYRAVARFYIGVSFLLEDSLIHNVENSVKHFQEAVCLERDFATLIYGEYNNINVRGVNYYFDEAAKVIKRYSSNRIFMAFIDELYSGRICWRESLKSS